MLRIAVGAVRPLDPDVLGALVESSNLMEHNLLPTKDGMRARWSSWAAEQFEGLLVVSIRMVLDGGKWRSQSPVVLRFTPDAEFFAMDSTGLWVPLQDVLGT